MRTSIRIAGVAKKWVSAYDTRFADDFVQVIRGALGPECDLMAYIQGLDYIQKAKWV